MNKNKIIVIIFIFIILVVGLFVAGSILNVDTTNTNSSTNISSTNNFVEGELIDYEIKEGISEDKYSNSIENTFVRTYDEFEEYIKQFTGVTIEDIDVLNYFNEDYFLDNTLAIEVHDGRATFFSYTIDSVRKIENQVNININIDLTNENSTVNEIPHLDFIFISLDKDVESVKFYTRNNIPTADKPIIYLYPSDETNVNVKLGYKENVTVSYPEYIDGWNVLAKPNGRLIDLDTNRELYSLYYECKNAIKFDMTSEGFIVKGKDIVPFLEEKLLILGLNNIEAEEFIIYWLPILSKNEYNYIRFATEEEINKNMPLNIEPNPEAIIRVLMIYKGLEEELDVVEQKLMTPQRNGFVAVEWGVTEIK